MSQWIVTACRAEAKVYELQKGGDLKWLKTFQNKKGRRKERDFNSDRPGMSYAKFSSVSGPHRLESKKSHSEIVAIHFSHQISSFLKKSHAEKAFNTLTVFAGAHFLGLLKGDLKELARRTNITWIPKVIEKAPVMKILNQLARLV